MSIISLETTRWGAMWYSKNKLNGIRKHIIFENCLPKLFVTKKEANNFIKEKYGYIANSPDLKKEPHGWRMPKAVRMKISIIL